MTNVDRILAEIQEIEGGCYGHNEADVEYNIERIFDRMDKMYLKNQLTDKEYDMLSRKLDVAGVHIIAR